MERSKHPQPALGLAIRQLRIKCGATQVGLAKEAGLTSQALSFIERGGANPKWHTAKSLAAALGVSVAELATFSEEIESNPERHRKS
jgi:DNA-binding XRE family transcriptional regulator